MKTLKKILVVIVVILAIPLIIALFVKRDFHSEREIVIDRPVSHVFDYVQLIKNQDHYGKWQLSDPDARLTAEGTDGTLGFKYSWDGDKVGQGSQTITDLVEDEKVETELDFGFGNPARSYILTEEAGANQTKVTWGIAGKTPYPFHLMSLFFDLGDDFEEGLQNLKNVLENQEAVDDKTFLSHYFTETQTNLEARISGLSPEQLHFQPSPQAWSISQCLEHIVLTEQMLLGMVKNVMTQPANPARREEIKFSDQDIIAMVTDRSERHQAPEMLLASGKYDNPQRALTDVETQRAEIRTFLEETSMDDLRNHLSDSPSGVSDMYQSLLFLAGHTARHTLQIDEIKAHPDFPNN